MRKTLTIGCIVVGAALMVAGYLLAAPWGATSVDNSNPTMDFAPVVFILGVIILFSSALVYELVPSKQT